MLLTRMGKFMYMQAWLTKSIVICMLALHVTTLKHCHIVAMGMTLLQLPNSLILEVLSIKHWRQSVFAETPLTVRHSRDARRRRASMLVINKSHTHTHTHMHACTYVASLSEQTIRRTFPSPQCPSPRPFPHPSRGILHLTLEKDGSILLPRDLPIVVTVIDGPLQVDLLRVPLVFITHDPLRNLYPGHLAVAICINFIHPPAEKRA